MCLHNTSHSKEKYDPISDTLPSLPPGFWKLNWGGKSVSRSTNRTFLVFWTGTSKNSISIATQLWKPKKKNTHKYCHSLPGLKINYGRYPKISFLSHIISIHMETKSQTVVSLRKIVTFWSRCKSQDNNEKCLLDQCFWPSVYMTNCKYMENC